MPLALRKLFYLLLVVHGVESNPGPKCDGYRGYWCDVIFPVKLADTNDRFDTTYQAFVRKKDVNKLTIDSTKLTVFGFRKFSDPQNITTVLHNVPLRCLDVMATRRDSTLVVCFDYGKGTPSVGVNVGEAFWDGGPTINFFNAYSSTGGYHSLAYSECVAGKGADEVISLLLFLLKQNHGGCGWLLLACDGEIKNISWAVLMFLDYISSPRSEDLRLFFGVRVVPYRQGHSYMLADTCTRKLHDVLMNLFNGHIGVDHLLAECERLHPGVFQKADLAIFSRWTEALRDSNIYLPYNKMEDQYHDEESKFEVRNDKPFIIETCYSWEWDEKKKKFFFVAHYDELWVKQSMDPKDPWRKIRIVKKKYALDEKYAEILPERKPERLRKVNAERINSARSMTRKYFSGIECPVEGLTIEKLLEEDFSKRFINPGSSTNFETSRDFEVNEPVKVKVKNKFEEGYVVDKKTRKNKITVFVPSNPAKKRHLELDLSKEKERKKIKKYKEVEEKTEENTGKFLIGAARSKELKLKRKRKNYQVIRPGKKARNDLFLSQSDRMICNGKCRFKTLAKLKEASNTKLKKEIKNHPRLKAFGLKKEGLVALLVDHYASPSHKLYLK